MPTIELRLSISSGRPLNLGGQTARLRLLTEYRIQRKIIRYSTLVLHFKLAIRIFLSFVSSSRAEKVISCRDFISSLIELRKWASPLERLGHQLYNITAAAPPRLSTLHVRPVFLYFSARTSRQSILLASPHISELHSIM